MKKQNGSNWNPLWPGVFFLLLTGNWVLVSNFQLIVYKKETDTSSPKHGEERVRKEDGWIDKMSTDSTSIFNTVLGKYKHKISSGRHSSDKEHN